MWKRADMFGQPFLMERLKHESQSSSSLTGRMKGKPSDEVR